MNKYKLFRNADADESGVNSNTNGPIVETKPAGNVDNEIVNTEIVKKDIVKKTEDTVSIVKPSRETEFLTIKNVSNNINPEKGSSYVMVEVTDANGQTSSFPVSLGLASTVQNLRSNVGKSVSATFSNTIAGVTQFTDKTTGEVRFHKTSGSSLISIAPATDLEALEERKMMLFNLSTKLGLETRIAKTEPANKDAFARLYAGILSAN